MKRFFAIAMTVIALSATGCKEWLDINTNPNYVGEADMSLLMPSVELRLADKVGYELALYGHFWSQYVNQCKSTNQYYTIMTYNCTNSDFTGPWSYIYSAILPGIKETLAQAAEADNASNYTLQANVLLAYNLYLLTSLYDKVAYTEGYLTESINPHFDSGEDIQKSIISILEGVRAMDADAVADDETVNTTAKVDMIFGGDNDAWFQFANTLYLKVLLRDFNTNKSKIQSLLSEDNFLEQDAAFDNFEDKADKSNPLYESDRRQLNTTANIRACTDILGVLSDDDPRLDYYYDGLGAVGSSYGVTTDIDESGRLRLEATDPVYFSTVDEAEFLKAEAYARLGNAESAKACYEAAIEAAFARTGCKGAAGFIADDYAFDATASVEGQIEQIINQKWASNVRCMPIESWFDINRTGYPKRGTTIAANSGVLEIGSYPVRFLYSKTSQDYNENAPDMVDIDVKMWWHK